MLPEADRLTNVNHKQASEGPGSEVVPRARRRRFSAAYKLRIVQEVDACTQHGQIGALLRREGLYSSHLSKWRQQRDAGRLYTKKRGPRADPQAAEVARLRRENKRLRQELEKAKLIIDVQKKLSLVLGLTIADTSQTGENE